MPSTARRGDKGVKERQVMFRVGVRGQWQDLVIAAFPYEKEEFAPTHSPGECACYVLGQGWSTIPFWDTFIKEDTRPCNSHEWLPCLNALDAEGVHNLHIIYRQSSNNSRYHT